MEDNANKNPSRNRRRGHRPNKTDSYTPPYEQSVLATPLASIGLQENTLQVLTVGKVQTVGDVVRRRAREMYRVQNFGKKHLNDLTRALRTLGVDFRPEEASAAEQTSAEPTAQGNNAGGKSRGNQNQQRAPKPNNRPQRESNAPQTSSNDNRRAPNGERGASRQENRTPAAQSAPNGNNGNSGGKKRKKGQGNADDGLTVAKLYAKPKLVHSPRIEAVPDRFIKFQRGGKWGFRDQNGVEVIPPIYDEVFNFKDDFACVERKQLFGYINRDNELVIPYKYVCASSFSEGYACVGDEERCGYINKQGEVVVPFIYEAGTAVVDGRAHVKQDGKWGTLTIATNEISWA